MIYLCPKCESRKGFEELEAGILLCKSCREKVHKDDVLEVREGIVYDEVYEEDNIDHHK